MSMVMPSPQRQSPPTDQARHMRRPRQHGDVIEQADRRVLERAGWRTFLSYRENHVRGWDGTLLTVTPEWVAEAERADRAASARFSGLQVSAGTIDEAWALLRARAADADRRAVGRWAASHPPARRLTRLTDDRSGVGTSDALCMDIGTLDAGQFTGRHPTMIPWHLGRSPISKPVTCTQAGGATTVPSGSPPCGDGCSGWGSSRSGG